MMWPDTDALYSKVWEKDSIEAMVQENLTLIWLLFYGTRRSKEFRKKMLKTCVEDLCHNSLIDGHISPKRNCTIEEPISFDIVRGFFHVTNLDVFREISHQAFLKEMVGDYRFSRQ